MRRKLPDQKELTETLRLKVYIERKTAGLTQKQCAQKRGISESSWSLAESGNAEVSVERLLQMLLLVNPKVGAEAMRLVEKSKARAPEKQA